LFWLTAVFVRGEILQHAETLDVCFQGKALMNRRQRNDDFASVAKLCNNALESGKDPAPDSYWGSNFELRMGTQD
jgi:hypothetical protein